MSWEQFREDAKRLVNRAVNKINQTADIAGLQLKLSSAEHRLSTAYEALGEAAYLHFSTESRDATPVMKAMEAVTAAKAEVEALRADVEAKKAAARAESAEKKAAEAKEKTSSEEEA